MEPNRTLRSSLKYNTQRLILPGWLIVMTTSSLCFKQYFSKFDSMFNVESRKSIERRLAKGMKMEMIQSLSYCSIWDTRSISPSQRQTFLSKCQISIKWRFFLNCGFSLLFFLILFAKRSQVCIYKDNCFKRSINVYWIDLKVFIANTKNHEKNHIIGLALFMIHISFCVAKQNTARKTRQNSSIGLSVTNRSVFALVRVCIVWLC